MLLDREVLKSQYELKVYKVGKVTIEVFGKKDSTYALWIGPPDTSWSRFTIDNGDFTAPYRLLLETLDRLDDRE